jgi:hypothetical protein
LTFGCSCSKDIQTSQGMLFQRLENIEFLFRIARTTRADRAQLSPGLLTQTSLNSQVGRSSCFLRSDIDEFTVQRESRLRRVEAKCLAGVASDLSAFPSLLNSSVIRVSLVPPSVCWSSGRCRLWGTFANCGLGRNRRKPFVLLDQQTTLCGTDWDLWFRRRQQSTNGRVISLLLIVFPRFGIALKQRGPYCCTSLKEVIFAETGE